MNTIDLIVLCATLLLIVTYGVYKSRSSRDLDGYFRGNQSMPWFLVLLSIMGTQASAITFISGPGQAYTDGMRFVQYYFGLPLAMIVICIAFVPVFSRLNVYTAYEYLEKRFDLRTRTFTAVLFLLSRGLSTGVSIYAPALILSSIFGWNIYLTNLLMGGLLIIYTVSGGAKAVAYTQQLQLFIIFGGLFLAGYMVVEMLPDGVGFTDALHLSGSMGKLNVITTGFENGSFNWSDKYNIFSGLIGGFFLSLSYFGTDQSQVGRYLTAKNLNESRIGLLMNGFVKVPMQFLILLLGALVFSFYLFTSAPVFFNESGLDRLRQSSKKDSVAWAEQNFAALSAEKSNAAVQYSAARKEGNAANMAASIETLRETEKESGKIRKQVITWIKSSAPGVDSNDTNYIFLRFVVDFLPVGLVGLLVAIIFLAAWGSIAAALNSLASSTIIDLHRRFKTKEMTVEEEFSWSRRYTFIWGVFCVLIACFATELGNSLIETVNILGSLFYGTILGIFMVAFWLKRVGAQAVFFAAILSQLTVFSAFKFTSISFLWYNVLGCLVAFLGAWVFQLFSRSESKSELTS
jgi:SSS family transporter